MNEYAARALADLIGGQAHQSGGNIWVVLYKNPKDGRYAVIGETGVDIYESEKHFNGYGAPGTEWPEPTSVYWDH